MARGAAADRRRLDGRHQLRDELAAVRHGQLPTLTFRLRIYQVTDLHVELRTGKRRARALGGVVKHRPQLLRQLPDIGLAVASVTRRPLQAKDAIVRRLFEAFWHAYFFFFNRLRKERAGFFATFG